ncbi:CBS domain-containing protein [Streptomyces cylindrosporus]|uniref:CBS domain-containing protein n=1 Tax=Streptomyces cylindrosporus TaxID=2927583 RepID=A0ABS9YLT1_9ACTN|nr:CBS domain-containing protein [Streptomyces cylindrosporus]MCI3278228.1 CBS domain-containing protein [Streptomyces cylindrosporus]
MKPTKIGALMVRDVVTVRPDTPFKEVARLLGRHRVSGLPVTDADGRVLGVVSETDLMLHQSRRPAGDGFLGGRFARMSLGVRHVGTKIRARTAGELMSTPAVTVHTDATSAEAARTMLRHGVERLPVVDEENGLVGIVTRHDLLGAFLRTDDQIRRDVQQEVFVKTLLLTPHIVRVSVRDGVVTLTGRLERRSEKSVALGMTERIDGVVAVADRLTYRFDDTRLRRTERALQATSESWLRKL